MIDFSFFFHFGIDFLLNYIYKESFINYCLNRIIFTLFTTSPQHLHYHHWWWMQEEYENNLLITIEWLINLSLKWTKDPELMHNILI